MSELKICRVGGKNTPRPNYGKPHVPVVGMYNGEVRMSCIFCGAWLEDNNESKMTLGQE